MANISEYKAFEYIIYWVPTDREYEKDGMRPNVLVHPKVVVARSQDHAKTLAAREIPDEFVDDLEQIVVAVRPF
jgi:hypothetical protein